MKNNENKAENRFSISNLIHKASEVGKKTVENIQNGAKEYRRKTKSTI